MSAEFAGALRERLGIERLASTPGDDGNATLAWLPDGEAWAALAPAGPPDGIVGEGQTSRPRYRLTLRARAGLGLASRFRWLGRVLTVLRVEPDPRRADRITLLVEERAA